MKELDNYYIRQQEPVRGCLLALRGIILAADAHISPAWKWHLPFFCYRKRIFCYLGFHKRFNLPYLALVEGHRLSQPELLAENRSRIKILLIDPEKDLPVEKIGGILREAIALYESGTIRGKNI